MIKVNRKFFILVLFLCLVFSSLVSAPGPGPPIKPVLLAFVINPPSGVTALQSDDLTIDLSLVGTANATKRVLVTKTSSKIQYPVAELLIDYTTDTDSEDNVTNVSLADVVVDLDTTNNKIVATSPSTAAVSTITKMYIPKVANTNVIVVCSGATTLAQTGVGCGSNSGVTEETIYLNGYTGRYTISSYNFGGTGYWEVSGVTGTGLQMFSLDFGGGDGLDFVTEGEVIDLDESSSRDIISREEIEYFILFEGIKYKMMVRSVGTANDFASLYVEVKDNILSVKVGDLVELDLDHDGETDVVLSVGDIKYPDVYLTISLYAGGEFTFEPRTQTEASRERGSMFGTGGLWSRFVGDAGGSKLVVLFYLTIGLIFVGVCIMIGGKLIGRIWQAT